MDLTLADAINLKCKANKKAAMQELNDFTDKVCFLEQQNKVLLAELEQLKGKGTSRVGDLYEGEISDLHRQVYLFTKEKASMEVERDNLAGYINTIHPNVVFHLWVEGGGLDHLLVAQREESSTGSSEEGGPEPRLGFLRRGAHTLDWEFLRSEVQCLDQGILRGGFQHIDRGSSKGRIMYWILRGGNGKMVP
ncbi:unnamed protein product [Staurois parvus]|uniref:IF rod domain-containing protein n=1 Tax=Staurois parvus TaxID=386267 RepID=A0ABN9DQF7_9NEOB|nr:unnamed protein product [Staurois parvus]